jgi:TM2 domain-containing membrane protein YozV
MTCYQHPNMPAHDRCANCGKEICAVCITHVNDKIVCRDCAGVLRSQPAPAAEEPQPEAQAPVESRAQAGTPAPAGAETPKAAPTSSAAEPSGVPAPIVSSAISPVARPALPSTSGPDAGAGGRKAKEPLLSAALSLILPGAGQAYNGQTVKGLVLAAIYIGSLAIIVGGIVVTIIGAARNDTLSSAFCCCLPFFIVPMIVLVYAIYDAYNAAEKINSSKEVREWP